MKNDSSTLRAIIIVILGFCLSSCANNSAHFLESEYSTKIIGCWQGMAGNSKESMSIKADGTFICQLQPMGFIANTLSQGVKGTVRGTWKITGSIITLKIISAKNEYLENSIASSTILTFKKDELVLKSDRGGTSRFQRVLVL